MGVVAHSIGCNVFHYFLIRYVDAEWIKKYVDKFIPISGVWDGASQAMMAYSFGHNPFPVFEKD